MRYHLGVNRKFVSTNCFRLLSLVSEVQNDVEVVKPVLEELEVMRLGCSLGMLPSVNPKDFEMELLEAREFDDDFALFLRKEVFGAVKTCESDSVKVISLFGKQDSVKRELERLNSWSEEMTSNLKTNDQGIYCVTLQDDKTTGPSLVLFGWIGDGLFRKSKLRDTATYVLRFLTCLSTDIVCCLSSEDIKQLQQTVASMNSSNLDAWKSFSVAFHVERQEEQKDAVLCESLVDFPLPESSSTQDSYLLKGSYPALVLLEPAPATKYKERFPEKFDNTIEFAKWMTSESKLRNIRVEFGAMESQHYCKQLLKVAERWPTEALTEVNDMLDRSLKTTEDEVAERVQLFIEDSRSKLLDIVDNLFNLDTLFTASKGDIAFSTLHKLVEEIQGDHAIWSKVDPATKVTLTLPSRLKNQMKNIATTFSKHLAKNSETIDVGQDVAKFLKEFTVSDDTNAITSGDGIFRRLGKAVGLVGQDWELLSPRFRECMTGPLSEARQAWFEAAETIFVITEEILTTRWRDETQRSYRQSCSADEEKVVMKAFSDLRRMWRSQHDDELMTVVRPRRRSEVVICDVEREHWQSATEQMKMFKILQSDGGTVSTTLLGAHLLRPGAKILKVFTIKTHCSIVVTTSEQGTLVERVDFPLERSWWGLNLGSVTFTRSFGRPAALCDFSVDDRVIAFVEEFGRVILYRFNETFSSLEIYKRLELGLRTSLTLPATNVLLVDGSLYVTDTNGLIQSVNLRNQQTSRAVHLVPSGSHVGNGSLVVLADNVALGYVAEECDNSSEDQHRTLKAVSSEDFRGIPVKISSSIPMNWHGRSLQCFGDLLVSMDAPAKRIFTLRLAVTVRSESFRIQHSKEHSVDGTKRESDSNETEHWLRVFYHSYEKFPVRGLIRSFNDTRDTLRLHVAYNSALTTATENCCRSFFQTLMRDLRKLNKPLSGMDLARDLTFMMESDGPMDGVTTRPVRSFLQELITFVPIQICRAEANSLTIMTNGKATSVNTESHDVQAVDIARSIRFGLLSPLLESWQGRCIVITSMGKQSTGKSYLLNHLTGSSFAIAGARCTDGAWMSIRILPKSVLLVVLDFEGFGSFERTEQEDVFLSVLNASISMFTIFRMEMRFDKEIDDLFARFQKGVALIKGDTSLFRGKLYMSVKDVNPNDQKGVFDEFIAKFQKLVGANKDSNFLLDLYSGQLDINCSPPLGTINYYQSLMHAQNFIENDLGGDETTGFRSGKTFLNCIRLVLAKIAILDWTSLDEGAKQFQLSEVSSKLAGLIRTGCIIPQEYVSRNDDIAGYLKEDIVFAGNGKAIDVNLEVMTTEYPALAEKWNSLSEHIDLDALPDRTIDLGFDCCSPSDDTIVQVHGAIKQLIRLFLRSNTVPAFEEAKCLVKSPPISMHF